MGHAEPLGCPAAHEQAPLHRRSFEQLNLPEIERALAKQPPTLHKYNKYAKPKKGSLRTRPASDQNLTRCDQEMQVLRLPANKGIPRQQTPPVSPHVSIESGGLEHRPLLGFQLPSGGPQRQHQHHPSATHVVVESLGEEIRAVPHTGDNASFMSSPLAGPAGQVEAAEGMDDLQPLLRTPSSSSPSHRRHASLPELSIQDLLEPVGEDEEAERERTPDPPKPAVPAPATEDQGQERTPEASLPAPGSQIPGVLEAPVRFSNAVSIGTHVPPLFGCPLACAPVRPSDWEPVCCSTRQLPRTVCFDPRCIGH